jgi:hypothetical protein
MVITRARQLLIAGLVLMVAGIVDPMEGSIVILAGSGIAAAGAVVGGLPHARAVVVAFVLVAIGVAAMFGLSSVGGFGGSSGRTMWWGVSILPYPFGWLSAVVSTVMSLRASRRVTA